MKKNRISREVAFALAMSSILNVSVAELGSAWGVFESDLYQEEWK